MNIEQLLNKEVNSVVTVKHNQKIDDVVNEKLAQFMEEVAGLYGISIIVEDTDWQTVYDLKVELLNKMEELGIVINY